MHTLMTISGLQWIANSNYQTTKFEFNNKDSIYYLCLADK